MRSRRSTVASICLWLGACGVDDPISAQPIFHPDAGVLDAGLVQDAAAAARDAGLPLITTGPDAGSYIVDSGNGTGQGCESHVADSTHVTPDMLVVLDRSGSMNPDRNDEGADRWGGSRTAVTEVISAFDDRVRFGLMTFPSAGSIGGLLGDECTPGMLDVPIDLNSGDQISSTLQGLDANGGTPTAPTLQAALTVIGAANMGGPDEVVPPKYVLLVTDGDPNCSGGSTRGVDTAARAQTLAAIQALTDAGVKTYVVGYQTAGSQFASQLDSMAAAGGTGETMHRSVQSGADLTATFTEIAGGAVSCSYRLDAPVLEPTRVLVTVDGRQRNFKQTADGWILEADKQTVTLTGAACADVRKGALFTVQVTCFEVPPV